MTDEIAPPSTLERILDPLRVAVVTVAILATGSTLIVVFETWFHPRSLQDAVRLWCFVDGALLLVFSGSHVLGSLRMRAIAVALLGALLMAAVWQWGVDVISALNGTYGLAVPPVAS